jgi:NDP-sugar pyrophosphorylase family protein
MRAAVLAGGLGLRLRPYTAVLPKPLVPVGDRPILELILRWLAAGGVDRVDICIGHLGELIQAYFTQEHVIPQGLEVAWQREDEPRGTAGALRPFAAIGEPLIVVNGDVVTRLDISEMLAFHRERDAALTIAMCSARVDVDLGVIDHRDGIVTGYREKPTLEYEASMGVYVYEPRALAHVPDAIPLQFPELVLRLLEAGERVAAFATDADWHHIGTALEHGRAMERLMGVEWPPDDGPGRRSPI